MIKDAPQGEQKTMRIKDQIRARREALNYTPADVAKKLEISEQAVRHWESGRSYPSVEKMLLLQDALSFTLDWTEGRAGARPTAAEQFQQEDLDLLGLIRRLPEPAQKLMADMALMLAKR